MNTIILHFAKRAFSDFLEDVASNKFSQTPIFHQHAYKARLFWQILFYLLHFPGLKLISTSVPPSNSVQVCIGLFVNK